MSRRVAREELFKIVFESELNEVKIDETLESYLLRDDTKLNTNEREFIEKYSKGMSLNDEKVVETLKNNITGWSLERVGNVEKALLKIATYEVLFEDVPAEIVVNEVVELAKKYGDEKSHEFINGVLAKIVAEKNN
ncbi:transcription antitermination factor NusB [Cetobacterium sp. 8H]|uniref:transcription antitermination factor NusB n=1 Tax=Cetobacterium sp. 8H TaxID=2759681 RepID=UPI00163C6101|nr:transcription antitermination factor NusB [Cetobacterium sp. 8H]MBC2851389.1 transcription antitermination factor NusB [Cetobacterium sp. 8H]